MTTNNVRQALWDYAQSGTPVFIQKGCSFFYGDIAALYGKRRREAGSPRNIKSVSLNRGKYTDLMPDIKITDETKVHIDNSSIPDSSTICTCGGGQLKVKNILGRDGGIDYTIMMDGKSMNGSVVAVEPGWLRNYITVLTKEGNIRTITDRNFLGRPKTLIIY